MNRAQATRLIRAKLREKHGVTVTVHWKSFEPVTWPTGLKGVGGRLTISATEFNAKDFCFEGDATGWRMF